MVNISFLFQYVRLINVFSKQSEVERFLEYLIIAEIIELKGTAKMTTESRPTERDFLKSSQIVVEFLVYDRICTERTLYGIVKDVYEAKIAKSHLFQSSDHIVSEEITAMLFGPKLENREWTKGFPAPEFYVVIILLFLLHEIF